MKYFYYRDFIFLMVLCLLPIFLSAEGIKELAPNADDVVMLLIDDTDFGDFAGYNSAPNNRLHFSVKDASEKVYLGLGPEFLANGSVNQTGFYRFRIRRSSDGAVVHGPYDVYAADANVTSKQQAVNGPADVVGGLGYFTADDRFLFEPSDAGDYYIEFYSAKYLGWWDISIVDVNEQIQKGRVWSKNWAFRTPVQEGQMPECLWDREFNGTLYSYTTDGFVSQIDFSDSGFQGLSFTVAFSETGPRNTGDLEEDRKSVPNANWAGQNADHQIFINEPDAVLFPDGICAEVTFGEHFICDGLGGYCLPVEANMPGIVEVILDFNQNGVYDNSSEDIRLLYEITIDDLSPCISWDGLKGDGSDVDFGDLVDINYTFQQGTQHWAVYDGEFLKNGFCVDLVRPVCNQDVDTDKLYWDDTNLPELPGTGQSKDGRLGCDCGIDNCRTWNNFSTNVSDCGSINNNLTTGYGDKSTLNTWWLANIVDRTFVGVPPFLDVQISASDSLLCEGEQINLNAVVMSVYLEELTYTWYGPSGLIDGENTPFLDVTEVGAYTVVVDDPTYFCTVNHTFYIGQEDCPIDLSLDKEVDNPMPELGQTLSFSLTLHNEGPGTATGVVVEDIIPSGYTNISSISHDGILTNNKIEWTNLTINVGETITLSYSVDVTVGNYTNVAEITHANEEDVDSTPGNGVDCNDNIEDDGDCVTIIPLTCDITTEIVSVACNNNGSAADASDDTYQFEIVVTGQSVGNHWQADNYGFSGQYNSTFISDAIPISNGDLSFTILDNISEGCQSPVYVEAPETCSNQCELSITVFSITCNPNGTPSDNVDDVYFVELIVTGYNTSGNWELDGENYPYDQVIELGPFSIGDGDKELNIFDSGNDECTQNIIITAPIPCSTECSLSGEVTNVVCNNNGTPSNPTDDTYTAEVVVEGYNTSGVWQSNYGFGNYGEHVTIGPFSISDLPTVNMEINDGGDDECSILLTIDAPQSCSPESAIYTYDVTVVCNDNGTPGNPIDDVFYADVELGGFNLSSGWYAATGEQGAYNTVYSFGPYLIEEGNISIDIYDNLDPDVVTTVIAPAPDACSDQCEVVGEILAINCDNNGTDYDPSDDVYTVDVRVDSYNTSQYWNNNGTIETYGSIVTFGPYPITTTPQVAIEATDLVDSDCYWSTIIDAPESCSNSCGIEVEILEVYCNDNNTPIHDNDDIFYVVVEVEGFNASETWLSNTGDIGFYNQVDTLGPFMIDAEEVILELSDNVNESCSTTFTVQAPSGCSNQCHIEAEVITAICGDLGDVSTAYDDLYEVQLVVDGFNTSSLGWNTIDGNGHYGALTTIGDYAIEAGSQMITIADVDDENCTTTVEITPPSSELICPPTTDSAIVNQYVQIIDGTLSFDDATFNLGDTLCWLPTPIGGVHHYDLTSIHTSDLIDSFQVYTFILYTDMVEAGELPLPMTILDGFGAVFMGNYYPEDPCCNVQMHTQAPLDFTNLADINPNVNISLPTGMYPVMKISVPLHANQTYTLATSTWMNNVLGHYKWVIVPHGEHLLTSPALDFAPIAGENLDVVYDLTYYDVVNILNTTASTTITGEPTIENDCGVLGWDFVDELSVLDNCTDMYLTRNFTTENILGEVDSCYQDIVFHRPSLLDILSPPLTVMLGCGEDYPVDENGAPAPWFTGYPFIVTTEGIEPVIGEEFDFNINVTYKDEDIITDSTNVIIREWTVVDECSQDTLGQFNQMIKTAEFAIPVMSCPSNHICPITDEGIMIFSTNNDDCTATIDVPLPTFEEGCAPWLEEVGIEIYAIQSSDTILVESIVPGGDRTIDAIAVGEYMITYTIFVEQTGETHSLDCFFNVQDLTAPVAICKDELNVAINGSGIERLWAHQIDKASYDNCAIDSILVRRLFTNDELTCEALDTSFYSDWNDYVEFTCCDVNQAITVELRVIDIYGNENICWSTINVADNVLPYCYGLSQVAVVCDSLPESFTPYDTTHFASAFGWPLVFDNCAADAIELLPDWQLSDCGEGTIIRKFIAIDQLGNTSLDTFYQEVTIVGSDYYAIEFPQDVITDCTNLVDTLAIHYDNCDMFDITIDDVILPAQGDECYRLLRTFNVINLCEYDGVASPIVIDRDENCNQLEGEEAIWVIVSNDTAYLDRDIDPFNNWPLANTKSDVCDGNSNPSGHWGVIASTAYWQYSQVLTVFDTIAPIVEFEVPAPICTDSTNCEEWVAYPFAILEECTVEDVTISIGVDYNSDNTVDATVATSEVINEYPYYTINRLEPIGIHQYIVTVTDICGNTTTTYLPFEVVDCYIPEIICYDGFVVNLQELTEQVDIDEDGDIDEAAYELEAHLLASCPVEDCSNPLTYSVNRIGQIPHVSQTSITLTCDDRYSVALEVYAWDNANNPYAVQPDGSLGGANYTHCDITVLVQDFTNACTQCEEELNVSGGIQTIEEEIMENVDIAVFTTDDQPTSIEPTNDEGQYFVEGLAAGGDYQIAPYKNDDYANGLTLIDVIAIQRHIMGVELLTSPWQLIAADVNGSGSVTVSDLLQVQSIILGNAESFSIGKSWMFIDANHEFEDTTNPWNSTIPEYVFIDNINTCMEDVDFVGVKLGDVNNTANTSGETLEERAYFEGRLPLLLKDRLMEVGETYWVNIDLPTLENIEAGLLALHINTDIATYEGSRSTKIELANTNWNRAKNELSVLWSTPSSDNQHTLLTIGLNVKQRAYLSQVLTLGKTKQSQVYKTDLSPWQLYVDYHQQSTTNTIVLYDNTPNPFTTETVIRFDLPKEDYATIQIVDVRGQIVKTMADYYQKGVNYVVVNKTDLPTSGVYYYKFSCGDTQLVKTIVLTDE